MKDCTARRQAIASATTDVTELHATGMRRPFIALLDALAEDALADLATIAPDKLQWKQGALAQLLALRDALEHPGPHKSPIAS